MAPCGKRIYNKTSECCCPVDETGVLHFEVPISNPSPDTGPSEVCSCSPQFLGAQPLQKLQDGHVPKIAGSDHFVSKLSLHIA